MKVYRILNLGAGVQSTTVALMGVKNWEAWHCSEALPYEPVGLIDYAIFADTQEEPKAVYEHLDWLKPKCEKFFSVLRPSAGSLGENLRFGVNLTGQRFVLIPAYTAERAGELGGITRRQCTRDFKTDVIERTIRREIFGLEPGHRLPSSADVTQIFGLSYDEAARIARLKARRDGGLLKSAFPLFDMEMTRRGCQSWLRKQDIPHEVPRSACVFCPYHSNTEWRTIKETDPQGWMRAVEIDRAIRDHDSTCTRALGQMLFVHRSCVPLEEADLEDSETKERKKGQEMFGFLSECEGMCGV